MRIVFLTSSLRQGGAERAIVSLSKRLMQMGHDVHIYLLENEEDTFFKVDSAITLHRLKFQNIRYVTSFFIAHSLHRELRRNHCDWIIAFDARTLVYSVLAKTKGTRIAYSERSNPKVYPSNAIWRKLRSCCLTFSDLCVFQTKRVQQLFPKSVIRKSVVIPNAIFNETIYNVKLPEIRENYISAMGRLVCSIKGFDKLIISFSQIAKKYPEIDLRIYGDGPDKNLLMSVALAYGVSDRVQIISGNENAILEIRKGRAFILSSYFEGFPNALLEALACGVPCISVDCDFGPRDIIKNEYNGILIPSLDQDLLAMAIEKVLDNKEFAEKIGLNAFHERNNYSIETIAKQWESALRAVSHNEFEN